jgi:uncharacterized protein (TIGR00251 family)
MIDLQAHPAGVVLPIKALPGSRSKGLKGEQNGALKVAVTQVAEKGKANQAIIDVLCKALKLRKSQVELLSGETSAQKRLLIHGITLDELQSRLSVALG